MNIGTILENLSWQIRTMIITRDPRLLILGLLILATVYLGYAIIKALRGPPSTSRTSKPGASTTPGKYEFNICLIGDKHKWIKTRNDKMVFKHTEDEKEYPIKTKDLYEIEAGILTRLKWKWRGITTGFIIVFDKDDEPISYEDPTMSAYVLKTVEESRALSNALRDEFKKAMDMKSIFIIIAILVVAIVIWMFVTGQLVI